MVLTFCGLVKKNFPPNSLFDFFVKPNIKFASNALGGACKALLLPPPVSKKESGAQTY